MKEGQCVRCMAISLLVFFVGNATSVRAEKAASPDGQNSVQPTRSAEVTLIGVVDYAVNAKGRATSGTLTVDKGRENEVIYRISLTGEGKNCLRQMRGQKARVKALLMEREGFKWLSVKAFKPVEPGTLVRQADQGPKAK